MKKRVIITAPVEVVIEGPYCDVLCDFYNTKYCSLFRRELDQDEEIGDPLRCQECRDAVEATGVLDSVDVALLSDEVFTLRIFDGEFKFKFDSGGYQKSLAGSLSADHCDS